MQGRRERSEERREDFVVSLGRPFLAHRLRRLSEALVDGGAEGRQHLGMKSPSRSASTLLLLEQEGELAVTEIAARLRLSHPLIIKMVDALTRDGLLASAADRADRRRRCVSLTDAGRAEARKIAEFTDIVNRALDSLAAEIGVDLYEAVTAVEDALGRRTFADRVRDRTTE